MLRTFVIGLVLAGIIRAEAISGQQLVFKNYSVSDVLVANPLRRVIRDSKGFLWITTWEGVSQYNFHLAANNGRIAIMRNGENYGKSLQPLD